ncbi:DUF4405 domain-containing protein [Ideonella sp. 4Y16]|uniref:DUF4405 domain-containing protein n=1 Tax=Ideonella alba TaxID=2824118 RepID=A0A940YLW5_9BURK|nr:DUF4405 domain-containing protein [Ideonella alba]MBQ0932189.1 DUF4405 domain-containing protein [Ideonella alba]MBQ0943694.1 DUF4405 domain-containing protein [Ideonella alba]
MKISREWATPLTIGSFALMAVTGVLMFFHLDSGLNKTAHEWLGWLMVAGVAAHAAANWLGFKRYFLNSGTGRAIMAVSVLVLAGSFAPPPGASEGGGSPPQLAIRAITQAPLAQLAPLTGRPVEQLQADLAAAGIAVEGPQATLASALGGNREQIGKAIGVMFGKR